MSELPPFSVSPQHSVLSTIFGSFRDPSGFLFFENGTLFRSVSRLYQQNYDHLIQSGLYNKLVADDLLIPHREVQPPAEASGKQGNRGGIGGHDSASCPPIPEAHVRRGNPYKIIQPEIVPFISYPYEWCFSQLKDAALALIRIQKQALDCNMSLKDASAYNMQFFKGKPILIDTLSFEIYKENQPWVAYRQFCQHFLAPLSLMASRDIRLGQLMRIYIDGLPLDLVSGLLPISTWFKPALLTHIHLHAKAQKRYAGQGFGGHDPISSKIGIVSPESLASAPKRKLTKHSLTALIHHLESAITSMQWHPTSTEWSNYYEDTNYSPEAMNHKKRLVEAYLSESNPRTIWDLGANTGVFSRIATAKDIDTIAFDVDPAAVEKNYLMMKGMKWGQISNQVKKGTDFKSVPFSETKLLPLCLDLTNPSPPLGWANEERLSLIERGPADTVLALALIHHLTISNNLPFSHIAAFLSQVCRFLIIEFVPKNDSQVQRLLRSREDIFPDYNQEHFEHAFNHHFLILKSQALPGTLRIIYLLKRKCLLN